ncbi:hypothetical protein AVEN_152940-1 [Araneus ventricosus]|uniref:Uncharacterized protein n=1 Tax=Araneus ventricosus TaxID=182803 RepID=A0A4Y2AD21_ARAVE|nr:hypothetical protein AVEN_152940-1 [Araneus ventricosus]
MDPSAPFPFFSSLWVAGDMNGRPSTSHLSHRGPFNDHSPNCLLPLPEQQPAKIRLTSIEVASSPSFHTTATGGRLGITYDLACSRPHTRRIFSGIAFRAWNSPAPRPRPCH